MYSYFMQLFDPKTKERHLILQHVAFNKLEKKTKRKKCKKKKKIILIPHPSVPCL